MNAAREGRYHLICFRINAPYSLNIQAFLYSSVGGTDCSRVGQRLNKITIVRVFKSVAGLNCATGSIDKAIVLFLSEADTLSCFGDENGERKAIQKNARWDEARARMKFGDE